MRLAALPAKAREQLREHLQFAPCLTRCPAGATDASCCAPLPSQASQAASAQRTPGHCDQSESKSSASKSLQPTEDGNYDGLGAVEEPGHQDGFCGSGAQQCELLRAGCFALDRLGSTQATICCGWFRIATQARGSPSVSRGSVPHRVRFLQSDADIRLPMVPGTVSGYGTRQSTSSSEVYPITLHSSGLNGESGRTLGRPPQHAGACFAKFLVGQTAAHDAVRAPSKGVEGQSGFPPTFKTACKTLQSVRERRILSEALAGGTACTGPVNSRRIQLLRGSEVLFVR